MEIDRASLPDDPVILREILVNVTLEAAGLRAEIDKLHQIIKIFQWHRYGQLSEKLNGGQRQLVIEDLEQTMGEAAAASDALGDLLAGRSEAAEPEAYAQAAGAQYRAASPFAAKVHSDARPERQDPPLLPG